MGLFSSKPTSFLGVDIGSASIKIVEFRNDQGRSRLVTYGYSENRGGVISGDSKKELEQKADIIKKVMERAKTSSLKAVTALPAYAVFSSILNFPINLNDKDLRAAIHWEAKKVIPLPIEEMSLSWNKLSSPAEKETPATSKPAENKNGNKKSQENQEEETKNSRLSKFLKNKSKQTQKGYQRILLTGAPNNLVKKYLQIFKLAGLKLISLETESFALVRSLIGNDKSPAMIVNFGSVTTTIIIVENTIPILNRSIDVGGQNITKIISDSLSISEKRADHFKQDIGLTQHTGGGIADMITQALAPVVNEIRYTQNVWENQTAKKISKIILTGGSANLPELGNYLSKELGVRTFLGDPWARVIYPEELKPVLNDVGTKLAVAIGLAMRNVE